jgi:ADP-ribose pyrophosphatase YjhB (NUDIX family)
VIGSVRALPISLPVPKPDHPAGWLPKQDYDAIYSRVPRLCVEVVLVVPRRGVLLELRDIPPNVGAWHIPGGTVLFGESLVDAVKRVALAELEAEVEVGELLGYIEYPSHYENGLDSPVGLAFQVSLTEPAAAVALSQTCGWFERLPAGLYEEQRRFLAEQLGFESATSPD